MYENENNSAHTRIHTHTHTHEGKREVKENIIMMQPVGFTPKQQKTDL